MRRLPLLVVVAGILGLSCTSSNSNGTDPGATPDVVADPGSPADPGTLPDVAADSGVDTIGGWVSNQLGRIPTKGTVFDYAGVRFEVTDAAPQMIRRLKIEVTARAEG